MLHRSGICHRRSNDREDAQRQEAPQPSRPHHPLNPRRIHEHCTSPPSALRRRELMDLQVFPSWQLGFDGIDVIEGPGAAPLLLMTELSGLTNLCKLEVRV